ncbi:hypothetical protein SISNIDRAFT_447737 [Sistotremastrum niveocremeum HHB9708]|uniref:Postreplication repair E3 ubiquitin-protein ligase RAD18 n=1 Tax=Sistotremastrum niveocremeum HHB9708 TaxID=1314777 RepID=A0A165AFB0_9AGAM|nr:hypothetical protein SISNIDRAFT_447737 [Sistotremastrum niveocremeum HHB9708]
MVDLPRNIQDTDPEDFANELLRKVDNSLKCPICKAYFDAAMYSDCGHTFCAVCLRESLSMKQECPICRKPAKELSMKKNIMLEDTLILWQQARDTLLTLERLEAANASKKRKRSASIQSIESDSNEAGPSSRPASTTVKKMKKRAESTQKTGDSTMTECPMCQNLVVEAIINQHIDGGCNPENDKKITRDSQRAKVQWSSVFGKSASAKRKATPISLTVPPRGETEPGTLEKLPRGSYDILKDKDLRRMLKEEGLPTDGETEAMKSRHKQ